MGRVLAMVSTTMPNGSDDARVSLVARARTRRESAKAHGCNYWVFEQISGSPTFIEFFEAGDAATLERAQRSAGTWSEAQPILREVEL